VGHKACEVYEKHKKYAHLEKTCETRINAILMYNELRNAKILILMCNHLWNTKEDFLKQTGICLNLIFVNNIWRQKCNKVEISKELRNSLDYMYVP
jgi:hypothetical protein